MLHRSNLLAVRGALLVSASPGAFAGQIASSGEVTEFEAVTVTATKTERPVFYGGFVELAISEEQGSRLVEQDATTPVQLAQAEQGYKLDIPPQPVADALAEFSAQTGIRVQGARIASDAQSSGVTGTYSPEQALQRLLAGTRMTYRFTGADTVTVEQASLEQDERPLVLDDGVVQLETISVTAGRVENADLQQTRFGKDVSRWPSPLERCFVQPLKWILLAWWLVSTTASTRGPPWRCSVNWRNCIPRPRLFMSSATSWAITALGLSATT